MKKDKMIKLFKIFAMLMVTFIFTNDVFAIDNVYDKDSDALKDSNKMLEDGNSIVVCEYIDTLDNNEVKGRIYFSLASNQWQVRGKLDDTSNLKTIIARNVNERGKYTDCTRGNFKEVFAANGFERIYYNKEKNYISSEKGTTFTCPTRFFINGSTSTRFCLADSESCGKDFVKGPYRLNTESNESIFKILDDAAINLLSSNDYVEDVIAKRDFTDKWRDKIKLFLVGKYNLDSKENIPAFLNSYIDSMGVNNGNARMTEEYNKLKEKAYNKVNEKVESGELTQEEAEEIKKEIEESTVEDYVAKSVTGPNININNDPPSCNSLLGANVSKIVKNLFTFIQYLGPVLIAAFSIMDFIKASVAGDEGQLKKAGERLGKRIVCGILLFFVPLICSILLDFGGITLTETCIEQYNSKETDK